jgi:hypothetical protein
MRVLILLACLSAAYAFPQGDVDKKNATDVPQVEAAGANKTEAANATVTLKTGPPVESSSEGCKKCADTEVCVDESCHESCQNGRKCTKEGESCQQAIYCGKPEAGAAAEPASGGNATQKVERQSRQSNDCNPECAGAGEICISGKCIATSDHETPVANSTKKEEKKEKKDDKKN